MMTGAGKFGLNLQVSDTILFLDIPYTPSDVFQYIGRVLRTGQTKNVDVYFFYMLNTPEEDLFDSLRRKQEEIDLFFRTSKAQLFDLNLRTSINMEDSLLARDPMLGEVYSIDEEDYILIP